VVAPSFGVSRTFDTSLERVWASLTDGVELARWTVPPGGASLKCDMHLSIGGICRLGTGLPDGREVWCAWDIRRADAPARLSFVYSFTDANGRPARNPLDSAWPAALRVEVRIALQGGGATATISLSPVEPTEAEAAAFRRSFAAMSREWESALDRLDATLTRL
jgi:uncharacterized protein YndB with AHSA1/START domain